MPPWSSKARRASLASRTATLEERFWRKVKKTEACWLWTGATIRGYGTIGRGARGKGNILTHVLSWQLHFGSTKGLKVLHTCDVRNCVRPDHLWLGTVADNQTDMAKKGRRGRGEAHETSILLEADVRLIRATTFAGKGRWKQNPGPTFAEFAQSFGVSEATIRDAYHGRTWKHIV